MKRTELTIAQNFYWKGLTRDVQEHCQTCYNCQQNKQVNNKWGLLSAKKNPNTTLWHTLCIDLIGPYKISEDITESYKDRNVNGKSASSKKPLTGTA